MTLSTYDELMDKFTQLRKSLLELQIQSVSEDDTTKLLPFATETRDLAQSIFLGMNSDVILPEIDSENMKEWTTKIASFLSQLRIELATYKKKLETKAEPKTEEKIKPPEIPTSIQEEQLDYSHHDEPIETYSRHEYRQDDTLEHAHDLEHYHDEKDEHTHDEHDRTLENHNIEPEHEEDHNIEQEDHILEQEKENPNLSPIEEQKSFEQEEEEESVHEHHPKTPARISFQSPVKSPEKSTHNISLETDDPYYATKLMIEQLRDACVQASIALINKRSFREKMVTQLQLREIRENTSNDEECHLQVGQYLEHSRSQLQLELQLLEQEEQRFAQESNELMSLLTNEYQTPKKKTTKSALTPSQIAEQMERSDLEQMYNNLDTLTPSSRKQPKNIHDIELENLDDIDDIESQHYSPQIPPPPQSPPQQFPPQQFFPPNMPMMNPIVPYGYPPPPMNPMQQQMLYEQMLQFNQNGRTSSNSSGSKKSGTSPKRRKKPVPKPEKKKFTIDPERARKLAAERLRDKVREEKQTKEREEQLRIARQQNLEELERERKHKLLLSKEKAHTLQAVTTMLEEELEEQQLPEVSMEQDPQNEQKIQESRKAALKRIQDEKKKREVEKQREIEAEKERERKKFAKRDASVEEFKIRMQMRKEQEEQRKRKEEEEFAIAMRKQMQEQKIQQQEAQSDSLLTGIEKSAPLSAKKKHLPPTVPALSEATMNSPLMKKSTNITHQQMMQQMQKHLQSKREQFKQIGEGLEDFFNDDDLRNISLSPPPHEEEFLKTKKNSFGWKG